MVRSGIAFGYSKSRQVEIAEEHDVGIEDAVALVGQRDGRGDLEELLDMPAADRLGAQRPPELAALALDHARQRPQPVGQEGRGRNDDAALAGEGANSGRSQSGTSR